MTTQPYRGDDWVGFVERNNFAHFTISIDQAGNSEVTGTHRQRPPFVEAFSNLFDISWAESLIGDLHERHAIICSTDTRTAANLWFWRQLLMSIGPLTWAHLKKILAIMRKR